MPVVFERIDAQTSSFLGLNPFAFLSNISAWRRYFLLLVIASSAAWVFFGFDSTWSQATVLVSGVPALLSGRATFSALLAESRRFYGTGNHWSAPVIYGTAFIVLSQYLEYRGIEKSENFCLTTALSLANIGVFEWTWNLLYAHFQHQPWTVTFRWKQASNLFHFTAFIVLGALALLYLRILGYRLNLGRRTLTLFVFASLCWLLWVFYPFPTAQLQVATSTGTWTSSTLFPQTQYAVDLTPDDVVAVGKAFWVENNPLHALNTLTKALTTAAILSIFTVRRVKP